MIGHKVENDDAYYMVWCPDWGIVACSAMGETVEEALENLQNVFAMVYQCYQKTGREIPKATWPEAFTM
jgi:predicted RNase H-like HicB family nuclease